MAEKPPKADKELSVPDRIRQTSFRLQMQLRFLNNVPGYPEHQRDWRGKTLAKLWRESKALREATLDLNEYFAAGYLELCRSAQLIREPAYWGWRRDSLLAPSYHNAAATWSENMINRFLSILAPKKHLETDADVIRAAARWGFCDSEIEEWAKDMTDDKRNAIPLLGLERVQALLAWKLVPPTSFTLQDQQSLDGDVEDVRVRSLGYKCKRCGKPAIVTSGGGKNAVKRYLRCQDRSCGWRGAAAKKAL